MNKTIGLIKQGWFPEDKDGIPSLTMLVVPETSTNHWTMAAYIVRIDPEDNTPRNLTGHPAEDLALRAQADRDGYQPGRIYAYRICKQGFSISDLSDLEASVKAIKTINRRVAKHGLIEDRFADYFEAVAQAIGAETIMFWRDRTGTYSDSTYDRLPVAEAISRIESMVKEAVK